MTKAELKTKWGAYTDTDKLVDDIMALLTAYSHRNTEHGVCTMLDTYFTNKEPLIRLLKEVDGFDDNLRLVITKDFDRVIDIRNLRSAISRIRDAVLHDKTIISKFDKDGKQFTDYLKTNIKRFNISQLENGELLAALQSVEERLTSFNSNGYTKESINRESEWANATYIFDGITSSSLSEEKAKEICEAAKSKKYAAGLKTSRAFNRLCEQYGATAHAKYNKMFAEYADMVADGTRKLDFVVSLNPYDYLTMSFGINWASCHTIDKNNIRNMPGHYSGQYCGGTLSYLLDSSSIITYVVAEGADPQTSGKIYRNMFHYENEVLVQGRVYPQGNDGVTDLYSKFRGYMHDVLNDAIKPANATWQSLVTGDCGRYTASNGAHYTDYVMYGNCNVTCLTDTTNTNKVVHIGHYGICLVCGDTFTSSGNLSHSGCSI